MTWESKIVGEDDVDPSQLLANPQNWRIHTQAQEQLLSGVINEVGIVQRVVVNAVTGHVVDGHLRVAMAISQDQPTIPVSYVELTEDEEKKVLATFDPIGGLASPDVEKFNSLASDIRFDDPGVQKWLEDEAASLKLDGTSADVPLSHDPNGPVSVRIGDLLGKIPKDLYDEVQMEAEQTRTDEGLGADDLMTTLVRRMVAAARD
jgi:hypothetical protein